MTQKEKIEQLQEAVIALQKENKLIKGYLLLIGSRDWINGEYTNGHALSDEMVFPERPKNIYLN